MAAPGARSLPQGRVLGHDASSFRARGLRELGAASGLTTVALVGCEGLCADLVGATNKLGSDEAKWDRWMQLVRTTLTEPAVVDLSEHMLYLGRAPVSWAESDSMLREA